MDGLQDEAKMIDEGAAQEPRDAPTQMNAAAAKRARIDYEAALKEQVSPNSSLQVRETSRPPALISQTATTSRS